MPFSWKKAAVAMRACAWVALTGLLLVACASPAPQTTSQTEAVSSAPARSVAASSTPAPPALPKDREIDFETLTERNEDVVAWVEVPGTVIDYPVVFCEDNVYYINHDLDGNYYPGGSIFLDMANSHNLKNPVVTIYGHYMPDDTLFTQLHLYEDPEFFEENREVRVFTPEHQFNYEVVAAVTVDDRYVFYNMDKNKYINYSSPEDMQYLMDWIADAPASFSGIVEMEDCTVEDSYLILSTCTQLADSNDRYLVVAKLVETR